MQRLTGNVLRAMLVVLNYQPDEKGGAQASFFYLCDFQLM